MGIQDRDYFRDDSPRGPALRAPQSMVTTVIIVNVALFLINYVFFSGKGENQYALTWHMACSVHSLTNPLLWWQLLTAGFAHSPLDIWHIVINMFVFWSFGRVVEPVLGKWEFLRFYLISIVVGSVFFCIRQLVFVGPNSPYSCVGASGAVTAVVILFILNNPKATVYLMLMIPIPAWVAGILMIALNVLGSSGVYIPGTPGGGAQVAYDVHLAGAAFAFLYFYFGWNFGRLIPRSLGDAAAGLRKSLRRNPKLRVHTGDDEPPPEAGYKQQDDEADHVLAKLNREGMESLSPQERKILEDYSRRMRQKHR